MARSGVAVAALVSVLLAVCGTMTGPQGGDLVAVEWRLDSFRLDSDRTVEVDPSRYTLTFVAADRIRGKADCNTYFADVVVENGNMAFRELTYTEAACPPGSWSIEFLEAMAQTGSLEITEETLTIAFGSGDGALGFTRVEQDPQI